MSSEAEKFFRLTTNDEALAAVAAKQAARCADVVEDVQGVEIIRRNGARSMRYGLVTNRAPQQCVLESVTGRQQGRSPLLILEAQRWLTVENPQDFGHARIVLEADDAYRLLCALSLAIANIARDELRLEESPHQEAS